MQPPDPERAGPPRGGAGGRPAPRHVASGTLGPVTCESHGKCSRRPRVPLRNRGTGVCWEGAGGHGHGGLLHHSLSPYHDVTRT